MSTIPTLLAVIFERSSICFKCSSNNSNNYMNCLTVDLEYNTRDLLMLSRMSKVTPFDGNKSCRYYALARLPTYFRLDLNSMLINIDQIRGETL